MSQPASPVRSDAIVVRRPTLGDWADMPRYWNRGEPFATHFLNALSSVFPPGEAFFVKSVMAYRDEIDDPELLGRMRAFAGQEGQHSHQHDRHLELLVSQGYGALLTRNKIVDAMMRWSLRRMPKASLAGTAALEHLTALMARRMLSDPERYAGEMDPRMGPLWLWHALEEAEHKAVAFDVLERVVPGRALRNIQLAQNTVGLFLETLDRTVYMLWKDGQLFRRKVWADGWRFLFGEGGFLRGYGADYRAWYRKGFHPDDIDDTPLIEARRAEVEAQVA